jgi:hypothetical protein
MAQYGLQRGIKGPTREQFRGGVVTSTTIDRMYIRRNLRNSKIQTGIIKIVLSDHYMIGVKYDGLGSNDTDVNISKVEKGSRKVLYINQISDNNAGNQQQTQTEIL